MTDSGLLDCVEIETAPHPTHSVILMHGLGADANDFVPMVPELKLGTTPAVRFVFPNAPVMPISVNNGMVMPGWYDIFAMGENVSRREDETGIRRSQAAIEALITRENDRGVPTCNIVLAGFSQGSAMTLHTGLRLGERLAGMVALSGYLPLAASLADERHAANADTPIFMAHGVHDPVVTLSRAEASRDALLAQGCQVQWHTYPMPHSVCAPEIQDIAAFVKRVFA